MNKKAFSLIELILVISIITVISISVFGNFGAFLSNPNDAIDNIESKITYEVKLGKNTPFKGGYTINGTNNLMPYIRFYNDSFAYVELKNNSNNEATVKEIQYLKYGDNKYKVETDIPDNTMFFKSNGIIVDKNGNELNSFNIVIKNIDTGNVVNTIVGNSYGYFEVK